MFFLSYIYFVRSITCFNINYVHFRLWLPYSQRSTELFSALLTSVFINLPIDDMIYLLLVDI